MCLRIKKGARQKIAKSDIECYKFIQSVKVISRDSVKHGYASDKLTYVKQINY